MKTIIFNAVSGFGNRLLPIISIYSWCKQHNVRMGVIWNQRTHRSGLPFNINDRTLSMQDYFESIPEEIDVFSDKVSALSHYALKEEDLTDCDMQWQPKFDTNFLHHEHLLIQKCCHLISLFPGNESIVGQRADLTCENQRNYKQHPYIKLIKDSFNDFVFPHSIIKTGDELLTENMTGLQLRNTDGGFTVNASTEVMNKMHAIIGSNECIYFSNDRLSDLELVLARHDNVIAYRNNDKFLNSDLGTLYSLVDLYVLSQCKTIFVASRSSFGLIAHLYSEDSTIEYWS